MSEMKTANLENVAERFAFGNTVLAQSLIQ